MIEEERERAASHRRRGPEQRLAYTTVSCALGMLLAAATERGLCAVRLGDDETALVEGLQRDLPAATLARDDAALADATTALLAYLEGRVRRLDLPLDVHATPFQLQVWEALRAIPYGQTRSYSQLAAAIGRQTAARAVARACAANPVALAVPCHRAVRANGQPGGYRWGAARKRALLAREAERVGAVSASA